MDYEDREPRECWNCGESRHLKDSGICAECALPNATSVGGEGSKEPAALRTLNLTRTSQQEEG